MQFSFLVIILFFSQLGHSSDLGFDHNSVKIIKQLEPLTPGVLLGVGDMFAPLEELDLDDKII